MSFYIVAILICSAFLKKKRKWKTSFYRMLLFSMLRIFFNFTRPLLIPVSIATRSITASSSTKGLFLESSENCNPFVLKNWSFNILFMYENQEDCEAWWIRTSALGNCGTRNRPEKIRVFWETGSWPELLEAWVVLTSVYYLTKV